MQTNMALQIPTEQVTHIPSSDWCHRAKFSCHHIPVCITQSLWLVWRNLQIDALVQDCSISSAFAMEVLQSRIEPPNCPLWIWKYHGGAFLFPSSSTHDDVIKWKHFPRLLDFVRGIHWSPVNCPPRGQWRGTLMGFFICAWTNG